MVLTQTVAVSGAERSVSVFLQSITGSMMGGTVSLSDTSQSNSVFTVEVTLIPHGNNHTTSSSAAAAAAGTQLVLVDTCPSQAILSSLPLANPSVVGVLEPGADIKSLNNLNTSGALPLFYGFSCAKEHESEDPQQTNTTGLDYSPILKRLREVLMYPFHLLWNPSLNALTTGGQQAFLKAFWMLDLDGDGVLAGSELQGWLDRMYPGFYVEWPRIAEQLEAQEGEDYIVGLEGGDINQAHLGITDTGFLALAHILLLKGCVRELWRFLLPMGVQPVSTFPFPKCSYDEEGQDEHDGGCGYGGVLQAGQLSTIAESFLSAVFNRSSVIPLSRFSPSAPWEEVGGFVSLKHQQLRGMPSAHNEEEEDLHMTTNDFLEAWRWAAWMEPQQVERFCLHWGFKGDVATLITHTAAATPQGGATQILVLGSPGCGKSSLLQRMSSHSMEETKYRFGKGQSSALLSGDLVFTEPSEEMGEEWILQDQGSTLDRFSAILLLLDGSDPYSFSYLMAKHSQLAQGLALCGKSFANVPCILMLSKADLPTAAPISQTSPQEYCRQHDLLWPPIVTSVVEEDLMGLKNEVDQVVPMLQDVLKTPEVATVAAVKKPNNLPLIPIILTIAATFVLGTLVFRRKK